MKKIYKSKRMISILLTTFLALFVFSSIALASDEPSIVESDSVVVGLQHNGNLLTTGQRDLNVDWNDITQIAITTEYNSDLVGLQSDGTVVSTDGLNTQDWNNIVQVAAGFDHAVGLKSDGTVVATATKNTDGQLDNSYGQLNVQGQDWNNIVEVAAGQNYTIGLKNDGTVIAAGKINDGTYTYKDIDVSSWKDVVQISAGDYGFVGLTKDGDVLSYGYGAQKPNVSGWEDIVQVSTSRFDTLGLKKDGTVISANGQDLSQWKGIVQVSAGSSQAYGVKSDGTVVYYGEMTYPSIGYVPVDTSIIDSWDKIRIPLNGDTNYIVDNPYSYDPIFVNVSIVDFNYVDIDLKDLNLSPSLGDPGLTLKYSVNGGVEQTAGFSDLGNGEFFSRFQNLKIGDTVTYSVSSKLIGAFISNKTITVGLNN